ncbi:MULTISPECIES: thiol reductant ABC exporter subunit CydC [unclassified Zymobacter]|uniref:thiol reductant ABC exporter subunit CydC n=1 Tax=unclassified Zymobacter TaxID=3048685 RepID=UPI0039C20C12
MTSSHGAPLRLRELWPYLAQMKPYWLLLSTGFLLNLIALVSSVSLMALSGWFISGAAVAGLLEATRIAFNYAIPSAGVRFFAITRTASRYGERVTTHEGTLKLLSVLRRSTYLRIEPLSPAALQRLGSGELMTRLTADIDTLDNLYLRVLIPSTVAMVAIGLCGAVIGWFALPIGLFAALALLFSGLIGPFIAWRRGHHLSDDWQQRNGQLRRRLLEQLQALPELLLYGRWQSNSRALLDGQRQRDDIELTLARQWGQSQWLSQLLLGLTVTGVLWLAGIWVTQHDLDPTLVALMALTVLGAFEAIAMLPQAWQHLGRIQRAARRINDLTSAVPDICFPHADTATPHSHDITIDQLSVAFDNHPVLQHVSLQLPAGTHTALLGPSGGGKTTLLNALVRFIEPDAGQIIVGDVPIKALSETTLRRLFSVAPQDVQLFSASLRDNLLLAAPNASDEQLEDVLRALQLGNWLDSLPAGLDSWPDEGGSSLSGGQLRRFGLARALLVDAPIVLLDEPTEGLEIALQQRVMNEVIARCQGRTLVVITHHLQSLTLFDRVAIFEQGRIIEQGAPRELQDCPDSRLAGMLRHLTL